MIESIKRIKPNSVIHTRGVPWSYSKYCLVYGGQSSLSTSSTGLRPKLDEEHSFSAHKSNEMLEEPIQIQIDKANVLKSYSHYSTPRILLTFFILKSCQWKWFFNGLSNLYVKLNLKFPMLLAPIDKLLQYTFFKHFCGGENATKVKDLLGDLKKSGVGSILDPAMEEDLKELTLPEAKENQGKTLPYIMIHSESSKVNQEKLSERSKIIKDCIDGAFNSQSNDQVKGPAFVAMKLTCLVPTGLLFQLTLALDHLLTNLDLDNNAFTSQAEWNGFVDALSHETALVPQSLEFLKEFKRIGNDNFNKILELNIPSLEKSLSVFTRGLVFSFSPEVLFKYYFLVYLPLLSKDLSVDLMIMHSFTDCLETSLKVVKDIISYAQDKSVCLMIDAEQSYFQTAIHYLTKIITPTNVKHPIIYGTYQMYLKNGINHLMPDLVLSQAEGIPFGLKLVRGAYMDGEKKRSQDLNIPDPICDSIEATHSQYHMAVKLLLNKMKSMDGVSVFVASHNKHTLEFVLNEAVNLKLNKFGLMFGQLLGMSDHLTFSLARMKYFSYKYVPIGSVREVVPYLIRRAQENSSILGNSAIERSQIKTVIKSRFWS